MPTFRVDKDPRYNRKNGSHRICLLASVKRHIQYIPIGYELTPEQYNRVFIKRSNTSDCIDLREKFNTLEVKAERIYNSMRRYDPKRFKEVFSCKGELTHESDLDLPQTLELSALTDYYLSKANIKRSTKIHFRCSLNVIERYSPGIHLDEIDPKFLREFEATMLGHGKSISTVSSYLRNLRTLVNYFMNEKKVLPSDYVYPFGKAGHSIKNVRKKKRVMSEDEILKVIELEEFDSPKQEFARDIWLFLYNANGLNPIDLLKLRWDSMKVDHIPVIRTKTETTRVYDLQEITIPLTEELIYYLDKVGDHTSPFVLGKLKEGYSETSLLNRKNKFRQEINTELKKIGTKLGLHVPLLMSTARDCYAMTLKRNGVPREHTSDSLGHSDIRTTSHYLDSLSIDESFEVNNNLVKRKNRKAS